MTIRNFLPGFGMRTVVALAVAAVVVVAALLTVGSPASAQTPPSDEIWSATVTVDRQNHLRGWWATDPVNIGSSTDQDLSTGPNRFELSILTQSTHTDPGNTNSQASVYIGNGKLKPYASNPFLPFNDNELESMTLHIGSHTFAFEDATEYSSTDVGYTYSWPRPSGMSAWTSGQTLAVKITAVQVVSIEAVTATVEYGGNNNAAESTAEFKFTRYGSTDNALSFTLNHSYSGHSENATRKFAAGQSSFSNFHWAIDVDSSNNPVCFITWQIFDDSHYYQGSPHFASVTVEGPGTTCQASM